MEGKTSENLDATVKILMKDVKSQASKISELEKKFAVVGKLFEKIIRVDKDLKDEKNETDKRFDNVIENFESCNNTIVDHIDSIDEIENKLCKVTTELKMLNDAIKEFDDETKEIENRHVNDDEELVTNINEVKQCRFDKFGFCSKGMEKCNYFHSPDTCEPYLKKGYCNKLVCRKRHPRRCFYFDRGYCKRNNDCRYLHKAQVVNKCKKCTQVSNITYFCEFCQESFCGHCIVEEVHIYKLVGCENIHH